jgi:hypothetical protein
MPEQDPIERYLVEVCAHFNVMPVEEAERNRVELRQHMQDAVDAQVAAGVSRREAVAFTIVRFGSSRTIGRRIAMASPYFWASRRGWYGVPMWLTLASAINFCSYWCVSMVIGWYRSQS